MGISRRVGLKSDMLQAGCTCDAAPLGFHQRRQRLHYAKAEFAHATDRTCQVAHRVVDALHSCAERSGSQD